MKKVLLVAVAGVFMLGLTSCKKDWSCECSYSNVQGTLVDPGSPYAISNATKKDAKEACNAMGVVVAGVGTKDCNLK